MSLIVSALLLAGMQTADPLPVEPRWDGSSCSTLVDGVSLSGEALKNEFRRAARHGRPIAVIGLSDIPYRCIGSTIFLLQAGGYRGRQNSGPLPTFAMQMHTTIWFGIAPGACSYSVNDEIVAEAELVALMADWKRYGTQVALKADPDADYSCVDAGLTLIKRAGLTNLGFVGNDQPAPDDPK